MDDDDPVMSREQLRWTVVLSLAGWVAGGVLVVGTAITSAVMSPGEAWVTVVQTLPAVLLGVLVLRRVPASPAGPALIFLAAAPSLTLGVENWGETFASMTPWPGSAWAAAIAPGVWVFNLAGFVALCLTFPDGPLPGRRWAAMPWIFLVVAIALNLALALDQATWAEDGSRIPGATPLGLPDPVWLGVILLAALALLGVLGVAGAALVVRYRRGDDLNRVQLRWLALGAMSVPILLAAGWGAELLGASTTVAYSGFMIAILHVLPVAAAIAIVRHDLLDVDQLLSATASWLLTALVSAGIFAVVVLGISQLGRRGLSGVSADGITVAAFSTALLLLPVHRWLHRQVGRVLDRERTVMLAVMRRFVQDVRDGQAQPEEVEAALRASLDDPALQVLLKVPGSAGLIDLTGRPYEIDPGQTVIPLDARGSDVGLVVLGRSSARRLRRAREMAVEARLPIEVSRLRAELRHALDDARASRTRLVQAAASERRRLERDLHDGAQQHILAVGMRLRSLQQHHTPGGPTHNEIERAVNALETTVAELRRLAHGIRPSGLDDGLEAAIRSLVSDSPIPVQVSVRDAEVSEAVVTTAYFVVAESLANTLKHAHASAAHVTVARTAEGLAVEVSDDGLGGARAGFGLTALRDRVAALGGQVEITSPVGAGTTVRATI